MSSIQQKPQIFNKSAPSSDVLTALDLIDHMLCHHQDEALALIELAHWHTEQAEALTAERRELAFALTAALGEAERVSA